MVRLIPRFIVLNIMNKGVSMLFLSSFGTQKGYQYLEVDFIYCYFAESIDHF